jgi:hypothetical protein
MLLRKLVRCYFVEDVVGKDVVGHDLGIAGSNCEVGAGGGTGKSPFIWDGEYWYWV